MTAKPKKKEAKKGKESAPKRPTEMLLDLDCEYRVQLCLLIVLFYTCFAGSNLYLLSYPFLTSICNFV